MTAHVHEIERLTRLYTALYLIGQAIGRSPTREELFTRVCQVLVEQGGFGMAWIGWHDPQSQRLLPVAQAGDVNGYLQSIVVYADEREEGRGPTGTAFRERRPFICNDVAAEPGTSPWRAELERCQLRASAAFPIEWQGAVVGTLSVYAPGCGFFQNKEVELLEAAAADLSLALDNLSREAERRSAQASAQHFAALVESSGEAIVGRTLEGVITSWNPAAEEMFGYLATEAIGSTLSPFIPPERADEAALILERTRNGERVAPLETVRVRKDGTSFPVSLTASPIRVGGRVVGVATIFRDISDRQLAQALAEREQRFAAGLIEAMPSIFYLYDETGRFLRWNREFERVSGWSGDEIAQKHPLDFFGPHDRGPVERRIAEVFERGEATIEAELLARDGTATPYFFTGKRIVYDGLTCLLGVGINIAERKRAEEALKKGEERYRTTLDNILEGGQLLDFDWRYLYLNPAAAIQNRRPNEELLGQRMPEVWPGIETTDVFALLQRSMQERVSLHSEVEFVFPDGQPGWFDLRVQPVPEGIFILSIDISERKRAETALYELNESLERKIAERTRELDDARRRAEDADRVKSAFLATMSHELRTPLNSIIGFTGIVLKQMAGPLNAEQSKQLGMVQGSARHLLDLINDVLDISKIEAGQLEVRRADFDLAESVRRVAASVTPQLQKKGLALHVSGAEAPVPLCSDRRRVEQILLNLLNNAIKFTDRGEVSLGVEPIPEERVRIQVKDTGIGIRPSDQDLLFQPFVQLDSGLQRQHEGTGLGLAICGRLTRLLGGTITVESAVGEGSMFTLVLPVTGGKMT